MKQAPVLSNLLVCFTLAMTSPLMQSTCHAGRTGLHEEVATDSLPKGNNGINLIHADANEFSSITWTDRASAIHVINKADSEWYYAGMEKLDKQKIEAYLMKLAALRGSDTINEYLIRPADEKIIIEGTGLMKPIIISVHGPESNRYLLHSTHAPEISFISDSSGLYKQIFSNLKALWP